MARGLPLCISVRAAGASALLLVALLGPGAVASDVVPAQQQQQQQQQGACKSPDASGSCPAIAAAADAPRSPLPDGQEEFGQGLSLLMTGVGRIAKTPSSSGDEEAGRGEAAAASAPQAPVAQALGYGATKCNEQVFQSLCYRTCTDMGAMEPRNSPSNCGGVHDYNFIQRCNEDGTASVGAGSARGISGRPMMGCFGDASANEEKPDAPNMCTTSCKYGVPSATLQGVRGKYCCTDGKSTPQMFLNEEELICSCSLGIEPPMPWLPEAMSVLKTPAKKACNTKCSAASAWLMAEGIAYCCPGNKQPTVKKLIAPASPDYTVECSCP